MRKMTTQMATPIHIEAQKPESTKSASTSKSATTQRSTLAAASDFGTVLSSESSEFPMKKPEELPRKKASKPKPAETTFIGEVTVGGVDGGMGEIPREIGIVRRDDILHENLTVYDNLYFAAMLRLPEGMDWD
jgi:hypothetical protein